MGNKNNSKNNGRKKASSPKGTSMGNLSNKAALYIRVSKEDAREGDARSLTDQKRQLLETAKRLELEVVKIYEEEEGTSASHLKKNDRPVWDEFMNDIGKNFYTGIAWALERPTRHGMGEWGQILDHLEEVGGRIILYSENIDTSDEQQRMLIALKAEMARDEIVKLQARVCRGKEGQRLRGEVLGGKVPFGLVRDKSAQYGVRTVPEQVEIVRSMVEKLLAGETISNVCRWANAEGHRTSGDRLFRPQSVNKFFRNPYLMGHRYYPKYNETFCGSDGKPVQVHEPLISEADYYRLQKIVKPKKGVNRKWQETGVERSPLFGLSKCGGCGRRIYFPMRTKRDTGGTREHLTEDRYAKCISSLCDHKGTAHYRKFHDYVVTAALTFVTTLEADSPILEEVSRRWMGTTTPEVEGQRESIKDRIDVLMGQQKELAKEYFEKSFMDRDTYDHLVGEIENKIIDAKMELALLPEKDLDISPILDLTQLEEDGSLVGEDSAWSQLDNQTQHEILMCLVDEVSLGQGKTKPPMRDGFEDRVQISFVTENNVYELKDRKLDMKKVSVAAS